MTQTRMTKQRAVILDVLQSVVSHPTADEIYAMVRKILPRISLGTVYRNLDLLVGSGEIGRLDHTGGQRRFDGNTHPHYHVRCECCGKIGDVFTSIVMPEIAAGAFSREFSEVKGMEVAFISICEACQGSPKSV